MAQYELYNRKPKNNTASVWLLPVHALVLLSRLDDDWGTRVRVPARKCQAERAI